MTLETLAASRVISGRKRGSSRPIIVETSAGSRLVKLRGAAQGTGALVAEVVVASLAESLGLRVPARCLVELRPATPTDDKEDELGDLLSASVGLNLGFVWLEGARDAQTADFERISLDDRSTVLWLDRFVMNLDRTPRNPNVLCWRDQCWLIDHGAALRFQYNWSAVTESTPSQIGSILEPHLFDSAAREPGWLDRDAAYATRIDRSLLEASIDAVPDDFLVDLLPIEARSRPADEVREAIRRRRAAYVAFLWKRLKSPRSFATSAPDLLPKRNRGVVPKWVSAPR